jgi:hypothetical protein
LIKLSIDYPLSYSRSLTSIIITMDEFEIVLEPLMDDADAEYAGEYRNKNEPGKTYRRTPIIRGDTLTTRVTLALLGHGTLTPNGEPASLLVFDFRLASSKTTRRFISANFEIAFRDSKGEDAFDPDIYRISPEGECEIDPRVTARNVKDEIVIGGNLGLPQAGGNLNYTHGSEGSKATEHAVSLKGIRKLLYKDSGDANVVIWTMAEDPKRKSGTPSFLRTALILKRKPGRNFTFSLEAEIKGNFTMGSKFKKLGHLGRAERSVPVDDLEINPITHVLKAEDTILSEYVKKINWENLHELNLRDDVVLHKMKDVLGVGAPVVAPVVAKAGEGANGATEK